MVRKSSVIINLDTLLSSVTRNEGPICRSAYYYYYYYYYYY